MLTAEGVTAVKSSTLDQVASLDRVAIQGIEIADICIVLMRNLCVSNNFPSPIGDAEGEE